MIDTTETEPPAPCTPDQKAEWSALHERMRDLSARRESAERQALAFLEMHVEAGAMTPGPLGVPDVDALRWYAEACREAAAASETQAEWSALHAQTKAHPYDAELTRMRQGS